jgi:hypothetical protein
LIGLPSRRAWSETGTVRIVVGRPRVLVSEMVGYIMSVGVHQIAVFIVQGGGEGGRWRVYCGAVTMGMAVALGRRSFVCRRRGRCWSHFCDSVIWVELTSLVELDWSVGLIGLVEGEENLLVLWHVSVLMDCWGR